MTSHRPMSPLDVLMYRGEGDPRTRTSMIGLYLLDRTPRWDDVVKHLDQASRRFPRLRERVVEATTPLIDARWVTDPRLRHRPPRPAPPGPGPRLVPRRPRPRRDVAHGPARHHPPAVGVHAGRGRRGWPRRADHEDEPRDHRRRGRDAAAVRPVRHRPGPGPATARARARPGRPHPARHHRRGAAPAADHRCRHRRRPRGRRLRGAVRFASRPRQAFERASEYVGSLGRLLAPPTPPSPLLAARSNSRRVLWSEVSLDDLKRAAKAVGGTVNDAYLATLAGALARYHDALGVPVAAVSVGIPIDRRVEGTEPAATSGRRCRSPPRPRGMRPRGCARSAHRSGRRGPRWPSTPSARSPRC